MRVVAGLIVAFALTGWAVAGRSEPARPDTPAKPYGVGPPPEFAHLPASSCSASACHGGGQVGRLGSEHTTWAPDLSLGPNDPHDPHAKAYRALFNPDSVRIARLLGRGPAHKDALCLKCHAPAGVADEAAAAEGVGCSACHGPAEKWVHEHYLPTWKGLSNRAKWEQYGFVPTKNLVARIANCATCHVGSADREVNHDLIAAGHPRLAFEYTRFHFHPTYRRHWEERTPQPEFEVRAWVVGQAASLRAAVDLLRSRAQRAKTDQAPWPEFAGYSCYACHQSIGKDEPKATAAPGRKLGRPRWEVWYTEPAIVAVLATATPRAFTGADPPFTTLGGLDKLMARPNPNSADVEKQAAAALPELDAWLAALQSAEDAGENFLAPAAGRRIATALAGHASGATDWDSLAASYLGCAAMFHATGGSAAHPGWAAPLAAIRDGLRFPHPYGGRFDSPAGFDKAKLDQARRHFGQLRDAAALPGGK